MANNNNNNTSNGEWTTIKKKTKSTQQNYDEIPTSFKKINNSKPISKPPQTKLKTNIVNNTISSNNILQKIDEGNYVSKTVSSGLSQQIIKARQQKGWTQKEFATLCNLNVAIIKNYENGTGIPKNVEMNTMTNILGVALSNK